MLDPQNEALNLFRILAGYMQIAVGTSRDNVQKVALKNFGPISLAYCVINSLGRCGPGRSVDWSIHRGIVVYN